MKSGTTSDFNVCSSSADADDSQSVLCCCFLRNVANSSGTERPWSTGSYKTPSRVQQVIACSMACRATRKGVRGVKYSIINFMSAYYCSASTNTFHFGHIRVAIAGSRAHVAYLTEAFYLFSAPCYTLFAYGSLSKHLLSFHSNR